MARKATTTTTPKTAATKAVKTPATVPVTPPVSTPVRNTPIPKVTAPAPAKKEITYEMIAQRAYEIYLSGAGGSEQDNWFRAERELRGL